MTNSVGRNKTSVYLLRENALKRRNSEPDLHKTSEITARPRRHSLSDLSQTDMSSPVGNRASILVGGRGISKSPSLSSLTLLQKKGEPSIDLLKEMQPFATASKSIYSNFNDPLPRGWTQLQPSEATLAEFKQAIPNLTIDAKGHFATKEGLTAGIFLTENNEICLAFGGTNSGEGEGLTKLALSLNQWKANAKNAFGVRPKIYEQAAALAKAISNSNLNGYQNKSIEGEAQIQQLSNAKQTDGNATLANKKITITGHSLGGGLAQYATAKLSTPEKPISCFGFCTAELGKSLQKELYQDCGNDPAKLTQLVSGIKNLKIKGDVVPNVHNLFNVTAMGESYTITPSASAVLPESKSATVDYHTNYLGHIDQYIGDKTGEFSTWL